MRHAHDLCAGISGQLQEDRVKFVGLLRPQRNQHQERDVGALQLRGEGPCGMEPRDDRGILRQ